MDNESTVISTYSTCPHILNVWFSFLLCYLPITTGHMWLGGEWQLREDRGEMEWKQSTQNDIPRPVHSVQLDLCLYLTWRVRRGRQRREQREQQQVQVAKQMCAWTSPHDCPLWSVDSDPLSQLLHVVAFYKQSYAIHSVKWCHYVMCHIWLFVWQNDATSLLSLL